MKYGVVVYKESNNIGDDIQSYAAAQLLPRVDYYIEREHLDIFRPKEEEPVNVIMSGWLMYNKLGWPISPYINPLYLSLHFWENDALNICDNFLEGIGGKDMREHQPIGCRDRATQAFLEKAGFQTWFSGCITLTLEPKYPRAAEKYICLTDVSSEVEKYVRKKYPQMDIRIIEHESKTIITSDMSWKTRFANVEELLTLYQNAKAVVTTRLHCALPCLAMGTPVLLLSKETTAEQGRFEGLSSLAFCTSEEKFLSGQVEYDLSKPPINPRTYQELRQGIKKKVQIFLENNGTCSQELKERCKMYDAEWEKRALWKDRQLNSLMHQAIVKWQENHKNFEELQAGKDWLEEQYVLLRDENGRINQKNIALEEQNNRINQKNIILEEQNNRINQKNIVLEEQNSRINQKNMVLEDQNSQLQQKNSDLQENIIALNSENVSIQEQNNFYYQEIIELKNSYSWRIGQIITLIPRKIVGVLKKNRI